ncbi:antibiotic biosynthesis monooxygenase [Actinomadura graeca]|uniref:Antibiotic biosynthesis monooxygenase n=1 Tax=Actinomadura graeca TaxID=2750812 RepID=A0ABX8QZB8_9ACTN|nr:antibiotic biosynthesis monooxygenase [Actinomadura graeca]QXJ23539.1 antibiotic biosynthesis monooxygenase [Actinomadura graeca]
MVDALLALLATLGALLATGLLIARAYKDRLLYLISWSLTQVGVSLALLSMGVGFMAGFNGPLFRVVEIGAALIGPVWLALGMIELIARYVQVRFAAWLFAVSYTLVAIVILLLDPLRGSLGKSLPKPGDTYDALPLLLIDGAHVVAVIALVGCTGVTAWLASKRDEEAGELLIPVALVALAGVLVVSGSRGLLPAPVAIIALGAAAGLVWYGAMRTIPVYEDNEREAGGGYAAAEYAPEKYDTYDKYDEYGDDPSTGYEDQAFTSFQPEPVPAPTGTPGPPPATKRGALRFPDQSPADELRFPDAGFLDDPSRDPAGPTAVDGLRPAVPEPSRPGGALAGPLPGSLAGALGGAPAGVPGGADLPAGCGQITVYTLLDGREDAFDRLAADLVQAARATEPDTVVFASHEVVGAPTQRIFYQLFRDDAAFAAHRQQPHLQRFLAESRTHVLATNVIELRLGSSKIPLPAPEYPGR